MTRYFVWEPSLQGPVARIWHNEQTDGSGKVKPTVGDPVELLIDDVRSIEELAKAYPHEHT